MVNRASVAAVFAALTKSGPILRFLDIDVHNHWRLQAQRGLFLEAQTDIDAVWPFDRILFPQIPHTPITERRRIYPDRHSHLEQMIDHHLRLQTRETKWQALLQQNPGIHLIEIEDGADLTSGLPKIELPLQLTVGPREEWANLDIDTIPPNISISDLQSADQTLSNLVKERRSSVDLAVVVGVQTLRNGTFQRYFDDLWTGVRPHPYPSGTSCVFSMRGKNSAFIR